MHWKLTVSGIAVAAVLMGSYAARAQEENVSPEEATTGLHDWAVDVDRRLGELEAAIDAHDARLRELEDTGILPPEEETFSWTAEDYSVTDEPDDAWSELTSVTSWEIKEDSEDRKYMEVQAENLEHSILEFLPVGDEASDVEIWAALQSECSNNCNIYTFARLRNWGASTDNVSANYRLVGDHVRSTETSEGSINVLDTDSNIPETQEIFQQRLSVNGDSLRGRWWEHGTDEPHGWTTSGTTEVDNAGKVAFSNYQGTFRVYAFTVGINGAEAPVIDVPVDNAPDPDPFTYNTPTLNANGIYEFDTVNSGFIEPEYLGELELRPEYNWDKTFHEWANPNFNGMGIVYPMRSRGEMTRPMVRLLLSCDTSEGCHEDTAKWIVESAHSAHEIMQDHWEAKSIWYYPNIAWEAYLLTGDTEFLDQMDFAYKTWIVDFKGREVTARLYERSEQERVFANLLRTASQLASVNYGDYQDVVDDTRDMFLDRETAGDAGNWNTSIWPGRHAHPHIAVNKARGSNAEHDGSQSWVQAWVTNEIARASLIGHTGWDDVWDYNFTYWTNPMEIGPRKYFNNNWWLTLPMGEHDGEELDTFEEVVEFGEMITSGANIHSGWQDLDDDDITGPSSLSFGHGDLRFSTMVWGSYMDTSRTCDHLDWLKPRTLDGFDKWNREPHQNNWFTSDCP